MHLSHNVKGHAFIIARKQWKQCPHNGAAFNEVARSVGSRGLWGCGETSRAFSTGRARMLTQEEGSRERADAGQESPGGSSNQKGCLTLGGVGWGGAQVRGASLLSAPWLLAGSPACGSRTGDRGPIQGLRGGT